MGRAIGKAALILLVAVLLTGCKEKEISKQEKYASYLADTIEKDLMEHYHFDSVKVETTILDNEKLSGIVTISTGKPSDNQSYDDILTYLKKNFDECRLVVDGEAIDNSLTEPPALTVTYGSTTIEATLGTYSWHYETSNGTTKGAEADALHPLFMRNDPIIALNPENGSVLLSFESKPKEVKAYYWDEDCLGDDNKYLDFDELTYSYGTNSFQIPTNKGIVVMIEGKWENGTALYSFRTSKESASLACTVTSLPESDVVSFVCEDVTADGMKVNLINSSGRDLMYGRHFSVERHEDGEWMSCKVIEGAHIMSFTDEGIILNASSILSVDWSKIYGTLQAGEYRLVLSSIYYWGDEPQTAVENPVIEFVIQ